MTGEQRIAGGLIGLLIGDAVGVPYEFNGPEDLPHIDDIDIDPPHGFRRSHANAPQYAWSDDGAHALCLLASLLNRRKLDIQDLANRLVNWNDWGYMAVDGQVFDVGIQTSAAISNSTRARLNRIKRLAAGGRGWLAEPMTVTRTGSSASTISQP